MPYVTPYRIKPAAQQTEYPPKPLPPQVSAYDAQWVRLTSGVPSSRGIPGIPKRAAASFAGWKRAAVLTIPVDFNAGDELDVGLVKKLHDDFNEYGTV